MTVAAVVTVRAIPHPTTRRVAKRAAAAAAVRVAVVAAAKTVVATVVRVAATVIAPLQKRILHLPPNRPAKVRVSPSLPRKEMGG